MRQKRQGDFLIEVPPHLAQSFGLKADAPPRSRLILCQPLADGAAAR